MKDVLKKISNGVYEYFDNNIEDMRIFLKERNEQDDIANLEKSFTECFFAMLENNIWRFMNKTFVYEFHRFRIGLGMEADKNSSKAYNLYVGKLDCEVISKWFEEYPVLKDVVRNSIENTGNYLKAVVNDFIADYKTIKDEFEIADDAILDAVIPNDSDPHNNGHIVLCVKFSDGNKVIYKPRNLGIDSLMRKIFSSIMVFDGEENYIPVPQFINRERYGWIEFINNTPIDDNEVPKAFFNLGIYSSVLSCISSTDMHDENIIFDGNKPYFIDLETSLQPSRFFGNDELLSEMQKAISYSIANTSIIPARVMANTLNYLMGAINTPYPQKSEQMVFNYKNVGTDAIDIAKGRVLIDRLANPIQLKSDGVIDPIMYMNDFLDGYRNGYRKLIEKKEELLQVLKQFDKPIRIVLRPTTQYYLIFDACLYPEYLKSYDGVKKIISYLKPVSSISDKGEAEKLFKEEYESLIQGDIPYFEIKGNEKRIKINNYVSADIYEYSPTENAMQNIKVISEKSLMLDERFIAEGAAEIKIKNSEYIEKDYKSVSEMFKNLFLNVKEFDVDKIYSFFEKLAITTEDDQEGKAAWLPGVYGGLPVSYNSIALISFHDAGGIVVFLRHLKSLTKNKEHELLYIKSRNGIESLKSVIFGYDNMDIASIISGKASLDMILNEDLERNPSIEEYAIGKPDEPVGDVFKGKAGIYHLLATYSGTDCKLMEEANVNLQEEIENFTGKFGIAHGRLGLLWTRFRVCNFLGDRTECQIIYDEVKRLLNSEKAMNKGWCNGYAGILMVITEMASVLKLEEDFYELAEQATKIDDGKVVDLSVCHGVAGIIQTLIYCYRVKKDERYIKLADKYWANVSEVALNNGFFTGEKNRDYLLGYFLGWSGIIDSLVLLNTFKTGGKLWIPLNLSSPAYQEECNREV